MKKAGQGRKCEDWLEKGRCTLPIKVECQRKSDCCWVEVNLATPTCWGYYQILNIGAFLSLCQDNHINIEKFNSAAIMMETFLYCNVL